MGLSITPIEVVLTGLEVSRETVRALCDADASAMGISSVR
jgi:hypothetical protein